MGNKTYALVGNWRAKDNVNGLTLCQYDVYSGTLTPLDTYLERVSVGNTFWDAERKIVYLTDEQVSRGSDKTYGGGVLAISVDLENEKLNLINEVDSLSTNPSFVCADKSKEYIMVSNHVSRNCVAQVGRDENGRFVTKKKFDDVILVLFRLGKNGDIGEACDMFVVPEDGDRCPHLHSVYVDPTGELYISCDKGLDKIYTFRVDRENGKLIHLYTAQTAFDTWARYAVFHPTKPYLYTNCENSSLIYVWKYDVETGVLEEKQNIDLFKYDDCVKIMPSDITISKDGSVVYASVRGADELAVLTVGDDGLLTPVQILSCEGKNPRGIMISPDSRFLLCANLDSGDVATFEIRGDGKLAYTGEKCPMHSPGNILFLT